MNLFLHQITLKLKETFTISRGSYSERKALIVQLSHEGHSGYGEASEHSYYQVTSEALYERALKLTSIVDSHEFIDPQHFWYLLNPHLADFPFLQCAFDNAANDLYGKLLKKPCHQIWGAKAEDLPKSSYTLSIDTIDNMIGKLKSKSFETYKIKMGTPDDMLILRELRQHTDSAFCIDANCAWTVDETITNSYEMKNLGVLFIEQPLKADDWEGMKTVYEQSALPVFADESCRGIDDVSKCSDHFHGINIKLMKCGGLTPALRMIEAGRSLGLKLMCGCMVESSVGISAIAQLLPFLDYVDMDGALLLANDPAKGATVSGDGSVKLPDEDGLGITLYRS